ncbi:transcription elongation factor SPT6 [Pluteus cervinus]|uniref:Transcription elongation factor SPT6 n=1 Tax=Pluteus cervinus TaxID=181527 RepID=A0ACD3BH82_9AGAR|nr:transcription elongation factor SPT6 [Pluteus cervinus]
MMDPDEEEEEPENVPPQEDDSSEEGEDNPEEVRKVREGFIVSEDEDEEEGQDSGEERRRRKKKRKRSNRRSKREEEDLEDDDLDLLEENTGGSFKKPRLIRLRRAAGSESPPASASRRRPVVESSDDDLDNVGVAPAGDIQQIWDDRGDDEEDGDMDMSSFIESDEPEEGGHDMDDGARQKRKEHKHQKRRPRGEPPEDIGIDANAWDEFHDVFGDGHDYDWALAGDDEVEYEEEQMKPEMKYQDVFEPTEIRQRLLTEDDDLIRAQDIPERMQLATSSLSQSSTLSMHIRLAEEDLGGAAQWVIHRLSHRKTREFFSPDGQYQHLKGGLVLAVTAALRFLFVEEFEVPCIWNFKRDYIAHFDVSDIRSRLELLNLQELWRIYTLGQKYRSLVERRRALNASYTRLKVTDEYYERELVPSIDSVEMVADATEWLSMKYKDKKKDEPDFQFHDDEVAEGAKARKMPSRISAYEVAKKSVIAKLAQGFGIQPHQVVLNFIASQHVHFVEDQDLNPIAFAEQFADPDPLKALPAEDLLARARMILATELGKDPLLRDHMRRLFREEARISVEPTERGTVKIDDHHPYFNFKYLYRKHVKDLLEGPQFLHVLAAENEHLVAVLITIPPEAKTRFERRLVDAFHSDRFSDAAQAWNSERSRVVQEVLDQHLIPAGIKWTKEYIREEVEDWLANQCANQLRKRVDVAPYQTEDTLPGSPASVLAVSWGKGDPHKDAITLVFLDDERRMREHTKLDNLHDTEMVDEFMDLIKRRKPNVIVVGGFSTATMKLTKRVKELVDPAKNPEAGSLKIPVIYVMDDAARIYQHSKRAADEFSALSPTAKYCVGLARYTQSPLNEYAALGPDITTISFEEDDQHLVPKEKLLSAFERVLVDVTNKVGVDINRAVADTYYQHLLPFVCGLGPRKAQALIKKIGSQGGHLANRDQFVRASLLTTRIFLNAAAFLRISQEESQLGSKQHKHRADEDAPDPLDDTRIHPEDYELARKMATDALELDEEDIHDEHPSQVVLALMHDPENEKKLAELNLDEFAISLYEANLDQKRHTLNVIREELLRPFAEQREPFKLPGDWDILTMLSGETQRTLRVGLIVSALVLRPKPHFVTVRLDSGIEGVINAQYISDQPVNDTKSVVSKGQTISGVIIDIKFQLEEDQFFVELSSRQSELANGDSLFRRVRHDEAWDIARFEKDQEVMARKKRAEVNRTRRVIKHPNFHNFNTAQAEAYLEKQQRGDVVIRPSSKGINHLAVTWKVDDGLYQHIDVTETNADSTGQGVGGQLIVDASHTYADLDELIVIHVQAMARRVEELMAHEKFKHGSEEDLHLFLKNFLAANPAKSMYGFTLNRKRPGHFSLCFLANKNSAVQTWPVRVTPEAYYLFDAPAAGVPELCDAFKVR